MTNGPFFSLKNPWLLGSVAIAAGLVAITAASGLIVLPYAQTAAGIGNIWDVICSAAGVPKRQSAANPVLPAFKMSDVIVTSTTLSRSDRGSVQRGATLAQQCAACHGPVGVSSTDFPNLAGQYAVVIYKELRDFKSGARVGAVMAPLAQPLSEEDMVDLAAYYASLPRLPAYHPEQQMPAPRVVVNGSPLRDIAPCGACHGSLDHKAGSPWLDGQPEAYLKAQLQDFKSGTRHNDAGQQMRNVARAMTAAEIDAAAKYYSSRPPNVQTQ